MLGVPKTPINAWSSENSQIMHEVLKTPVMHGILKNSSNTWGSENPW